MCDPKKRLCERVLPEGTSFKELNQFTVQTCLMFDEVESERRLGCAIRGYNSLNGSFAVISNQCSSALAVGEGSVPAGMLGDSPRVDDSLRVGILSVTRQEASGAILLRLCVCARANRLRIAERGEGDG